MEWDKDNFNLSLFLLLTFVFHGHGHICKVVSTDRFHGARQTVVTRKSSAGLAPIRLHHLLLFLLLRLYTSLRIVSMFFCLVPAVGQQVSQRSCILEEPPNDRSKSKLVIDELEQIVHLLDLELNFVTQLVGLMVATSLISLHLSHCHV